MKKQYDLKTEWEKTKKMLTKFSQEAALLAKKGEEELVVFSKKSKMHIDATATHLKIEKLYYEIGKEYAHLKDPTKSSDKLDKLIREIHAFEKEEKTIKSKISKKKKAAPKKKASKKS